MHLCARIVLNHYCKMDIQVHLARVAAFMSKLLISEKLPKVKSKDKHRKKLDNHWE